MTKKSITYNHDPSIGFLFYGMLAMLFLIGCQGNNTSVPITSNGHPATLEITKSGESSLRITLKPTDYQGKLPDNPALAQKDFGDPLISLTGIQDVIEENVANMSVAVSADPLMVKIFDDDKNLIQQLTFEENGNVRFLVDDQPILGMGEGGPRIPRDTEWRDLPIEFDRKGRYHKMEPRWQSNAYGSRNPIALLWGTSGWGLFVASPWVEVDLNQGPNGIFIPWQPPETRAPQNKENQHENTGKGIPEIKSIVPGLFDVFVFNASDPTSAMNDLAELSGRAVMPPKWAMGYMQSHRTLKDSKQIIDVVDTFREKKIPVDAVIYLGTGFVPSGWNKMQPSFEFNPDVFGQDPQKVIDALKDRDVKVVVHMVPWDRDKLPTLHGSIPPQPDEALDDSHIANYWKQHEDLVHMGIDAFWPDEGDWFNLNERLTRHKMYYQGPLSTTPNVRPWSLHRNGYLGIAQWGGWVWSGDTQSAWKTLEGQIAVGINYSLSLSPFWGSDIGGFYPNKDKTGEMYARWFQFGAFCPSFRSHGRTWYTALPWGFGLSDMGVREPNNRNDTTASGAQGRWPLQSSMNDKRIEPVTKKYAELRYQLLPYNYTLSWEARDKGLPMMRALWLHYPGDQKAREIGDEYLWGRDMIIAPVYEKEAASRTVYLPEGAWYDWWTNEKIDGGNTINRVVDLATMPIYVRSGAIIPMDPIRQYTWQMVNEPTTLKIFPGTDGEYILYEDDGISLDYQKGEFSLTKFTWLDSERKLRIEPADEKTSVPERTYKIEIISEKNNNTLITYDGQLVEVNI